MVEGEEVVYLGRGEKRFYVWRYSLHDAKGGKKEKVVEKEAFYAEVQGLVDSSERVDEGIIIGDGGVGGGCSRRRRSLG